VVRHKRERDQRDSDEMESERCQACMEMEGLRTGRGKGEGGRLAYFNGEPS
jgi:hypothetical protein